MTHFDALYTYYKIECCLEPSSGIPVKFTYGSSSATNGETVLSTKLPKAKR